MTQWKYTDELRNVVWRQLEDGTQESCLVGREDVQQHIADGGAIDAPDAPLPAPEPTKADLLSQIQALMTQVEALK